MSLLSKAALVVVVVLLVGNDSLDSEDLCANEPNASQSGSNPTVGLLSRESSSAAVAQKADGRFGVDAAMPSNCGLMRLLCVNTDGLPFLSLCDESECDTIFGMNVGRSLNIE